MHKKLVVFLLIIVLASSYTIQYANSSSSGKILSPLQQSKMHASISQIICHDNLLLVMKKSDGSPACVKKSSESILIERGWALHVLPDYTAGGSKNSDMFDGRPLEIKTVPVNYFENSIGYLAEPAQNGNYPGIIMIHEWWGLNDNIKSMAKGLASHGYIVLAVDLYAGQVATTSDGARKLLLTFDEQKAMQNIGAAEYTLKQKYNASKIGTIGWCFGGSQSLNYALSGNKVDATVLYYGQPVTNTTALSVIKWPVLGFYGDQDQSNSLDKIKEFKSDLDSLGIQNEIYIYPGLGHAFANPSGATYAPKETSDAWNKTVSFFEENLK
jgi:carboxymethylenebutenolidase